MFEELISKIALSLEKASLPYMIIGGQAVLLYGEPRLTKDIDITIGKGIEAAETILKISEAIDLKPIISNPVDFVRTTMVLPMLHNKTKIRVDFIFSFTPYEMQAIKRGKKVAINKVKVNFISPEDLIIHKIFSGRPIDIEDARKIILKNPEMDFKYIEYWLKELGKALGQDFISVLKKLITPSTSE